MYYKYEIRLFLKLAPFVTFACIVSSQVERCRLPQVNTAFPYHLRDDNRLAGGVTYRDGYLRTRGFIVKGKRPQIICVLTT